MPVCLNVSVDVCYSKHCYYFLLVLSFEFFFFRQIVSGTGFVFITRCKEINVSNQLGHSERASHYHWIPEEVPSLSSFVLQVHLSSNLSVPTFVDGNGSCFQNDVFERTPDGGPSLK
jgi:hypothetical protein